eukprot:gnl/MRDRNA2_/MRDRNA2_136445_c0_seq1.p1 gnl/MRDRNA2_/MRDRNA2_136445_c0~~gnl/MRDRNA2_/MRDRNA2_136445_c0_seq1.p1  ORF type:complete len:515 (-),score=114.37 gnl/MRDRNA2_/MRDRNA2_136445_c0_seq1:131-1675(-)
MVTSFYSVLGLDPKASQQEIRLAFKQRALSTHPDKGGNGSAFRVVMEAFETLVDARRRMEHDLMLHHAEDERSRPKRKYESSPSPQTKKPKTQCASCLAAKGSTTKGGMSRNARRNQRTAVFSAVTKKRSVQTKQDPAARLYHLLRLMRPSWRRMALTEKFSESQRLALEQWILAQKAQQKPLRMQRQQNRSEDDFARKQQNEHPKWWEKHTQQDARSVYRAPTAQVPKSCADKCSSEINSSNKDLLEQRCQPKINGHRGLVQVKGIASHTRVVPGRRTNEVWYSARVTVGMIWFVTKEVLDLAASIEFLVILTSIKQRAIVALDSVKASAPDTFELIVREAVVTTLKEHGVDGERDLGLRFYICIPAHGWIGRKLMTPSFHISDLDLGLRAWRRLQQARGEVHHGHRISQRCGPGDSWSMWIHVRETFLGVLDEMGHSRANGMAKLEAHERAHKPLQERVFERWNRQAMAREERHQRAVLRFQHRSPSKNDARAVLERLIETWLERWTSATQE